MSKRFQARMALGGLLVAVCLPFLAVAKPPDLPIRSVVECEDQPPPRVGEIKVLGNFACADGNLHGKGGSYPLSIFVLDPNCEGPFSAILAAPTLLDDLKGLVCPGVEDVVESWWRTLLKHLPVTNGGGVDPKLTLQRFPSSDELHQIEYVWERLWFPDPSPGSMPQRTQECLECKPLPAVERLTVLPKRMPQAAVCEHSCCCQGPSGVVQAGAKESVKTDKPSGWPRIKIELTIEFK